MPAVDRIDGSGVAEREDDADADDDDDDDDTAVVDVAVCSRAESACDEMRTARIIDVAAVAGGFNVAAVSFVEP